MTRMWLLPPGHMCQQHILGEHYELHKLVGGIKAALDGDDGHRARIAGQARDGNVDVRQITERHRELEAYGGWDSPLPKVVISGATCGFAIGDIDVEANRRDLRERCADCAAAMEVPA